MTAKKRKRRSGYRAPSRAPTISQPRSVATEHRPRPLLGFLAPSSGDASLPTVRSSLARGFVAVGSSPGLLAGPLLFVLLAWLGLIALGLEGPPGRLVDLMALPPISTYFDALNGVTIYGNGPPGFAAAAGFLVVRAVVLAVLSGIIIERLEGGRALVGVRRGLRAFPIVLAVTLLGFSFMIVVSLILPALGPGIGFLGSVVMLAAGVFLFSFAPAAAIREGRGLSETVRRSARAALLPGGHNVLMAVLYLFLALPVLLALAPGGNILTVNPGVGMWLYALLATFMHVGFLAAYCRRWMAAEPLVQQAPPKRPR